MTKSFWEGTTSKIVKAMKATGNKPGIIAQWKALVDAWAGTADPTIDPNKAAVRDWLPMWQVRPFYTAGELAPIFPALAVVLNIQDRPGPIKSPMRLQHELIFAGLPILRSTENEDFFEHPEYGHCRRYFIVEQIHHWKNCVLSPQDFAEFINASR